MGERTSNIEHPTSNVEREKEIDRGGVSLDILGKRYQPAIFDVLPECQQLFVVVNPCILTFSVNDVFQRDGFVVFTILLRRYPNVRSFLAGDFIA